MSLPSLSPLQGLKLLSDFEKHWNIVEENRICSAVIAASSPALGRDCWEAVLQARSSLLCQKRQSHSAAALLASIGDIYGAINAYRSVGLFTEALILARLRLTPMDPFLRQLALDIAIKFLENGRSTSSLKDMAKGELDSAPWLNIEREHVMHTEKGESKVINQKEILNDGCFKSGAKMNIEECENNRNIEDNGGNDISDEADRIKIILVSMRKFIVGASSRDGSDAAYSLFSLNLLRDFNSSLEVLLPIPSNDGHEGSNCLSNNTEHIISAQMAPRSTPQTPSSALCPAYHFPPPHVLAAQLLSHELILPAAVVIERQGLAGSLLTAALLLSKSEEKLTQENMPKAAVLGSRCIIASVLPILLNLVVAASIISQVSNHHSQPSSNISLHPEILHQVQLLSNLSGVFGATLNKVKNKVNHADDFPHHPYLYSATSGLNDTLEEAEAAMTAVGALVALIGKMLIRLNKKVGNEGESICQDNATYREVTAADISNEPMVSINDASISWAYSEGKVKEGNYTQQDRKGKGSSTDLLTTFLEILDANLLISEMVDDVKTTVDDKSNDTSECRDNHCDSNMNLNIKDENHSTCIHDNANLTRSAIAKKPSIISRGRILTCFLASTAQLRQAENTALTTLSIKNINYSSNGCNNTICDSSVQSYVIPLLYTGSTIVVTRSENCNNDEKKSSAFKESSSFMHKYDERKSTNILSGVPKVVWAQAMHRIKTCIHALITVAGEST